MKLHLQMNFFNSEITISFFFYWEALFHQLYAGLYYWTINKPSFELKTGGVVNRDKRGDKQLTKELDDVRVKTNREKKTG